MNNITAKLPVASLICLLVLVATDGRPQSQAPSQPQQPAQSKSQSAEGTYTSEVVADGQGTLPFTLIVKRDGNKLTTEVKDGGDLNITGITVDGENVTLAANYQGQPFELPGKFTADGMGGKWAAGGYSGTWTAKRRSEQQSNR